MKSPAPVINPSPGQNLPPGQHLTPGRLLSRYVTVLKFPKSKILHAEVLIGVHVFKNNEEVYLFVEQYIGASVEL